MARLLAVLTAMLISLGFAHAKSVKVLSDPPGARVFKVSDQTEELLGIAPVPLKLAKNSPNRVKVVLEGYAPVFMDFPATGQYDKQGKTIQLTARLVKLATRPAGAEVTQDGITISNKSSADVVVPRDESITVEVKKSGFETVERTYHNLGDEVPPISDTVELTTRAVMVQATPKGAQVWAADDLVGEDNGKIFVPEGECVVATVSKLGFKEVNKSYCNVEGPTELPITDPIALVDRVVSIRTTPAEAAILIEGREAETGQFDLTVAEGKCIDVTILLESYVPRYERYCNQTNAPEPPAEEDAALDLDAAYVGSVTSDVANTAFEIRVKETLHPNTAWKTIMEILTRGFKMDMLDKDTGYIQTTWRFDNFNANTIRTRVVMMQIDDDPLVYRMTVESEHSGEGATKPSCEECFKDWDRILKNHYEGLFEEMPARLQ